MWLNESYNKETFENFLSNFLPEDLDLFEKKLVISKNYKEIKSGVVLGECPSLGLKVLQLEHEKERDPRVALAKEAFKAMAENWAKKALIVFTSKNSDNWRLSFMTIFFDINEKNKVVTNLSNPKRKSFFLGPDSKTATPNKFLIKSGEVKNIEDLESRFDVEVVTKEFFDNYRKLFDKLNAHLKEDGAFNVFAGNNRIKIDDFAKKLLGQIVFIYFLQRKGWLGAKKEQHIYEGDSNFIRNLYNRSVNKKGSFFNDTLEYLFYNAFNKEPEKAGSFYREYFDCQIPFLNGGLFESLNKYDWEKEFLYLPNDLFSNSDKTGILDIFDLYNFTIDENSPIDQEVSVDPEMLGKVFEKLLDTNKKTGSFYTRREIVSYMVKQSLIEYLKTKTDVKDKDIEELINEHKISSLDLNKKDFKAIEDALKEIKIIDPAVGSGAFPVGILQEMTEIRLICQGKISTRPKLPHTIKKEILENNIYGVDIDHGAIDIARLRFWLSLVVDADLFDVEPLPNLDFKLVAANTLLKLNGEVGIWDDKDLLNKMEELREKYFRTRTANGKERIQKAYKKLICASNNILATERQKKIITYNPFSPSFVAQFFDPEFMFGVKEFDLVIGNPPYVDYRKIDQQTKNGIKDFLVSSYSKMINLYNYFFEIGINLLRSDGVLAYITPQQYLILDNCKGSRDLLRSNRVLLLADFARVKIFSASTYTFVSIIQKQKSNKSATYLEFNQVTNLNYFVRKLEIINPIPEPVNISEHVSIINKIEKNGSTILASMADIFCASSSSALKFVDNAEHGVNFITASDIKNWYINDASQYVLKNSYSKISEKKQRGSVIYTSRMTTSIRAALIDDNQLLGGKVNVVILNDESLELLVVSLLNSKLINFWYREKYSMQHMQGGALPINTTELNKIPVGTQKEIYKDIKVLAEKIQALKKQNKEADIANIELQIDEFIYRLYGLTKEEIKVIEDWQK